MSTKVEAMKEPKAPTKPKKPSKPKAPKKTIKGKPEIKISRWANDNLDAILDDLVFECVNLKKEDFDFTKLVIDGSDISCYHHGYYDEVDIDGDIKVRYNVDVELHNPMYSKLLTAYKRAMAVYPKQLEHYENKYNKWLRDSVKYRTEMAKYRKLQEEKELEEARKLLKKAGEL